MTLSVAPTPLAEASVCKMKQSVLVGIEDVYHSLGCNLCCNVLQWYGLWPPGSHTNGKSGDFKILPLPSGMDPRNKSHAFEGHHFYRSQYQCCLPSWGSIILLAHCVQDLQWTTISFTIPGQGKCLPITCLAFLLPACPNLSWAKVSTLCLWDLGSTMSSWVCSKWSTTLFFKRPLSYQYFFSSSLVNPFQIFRFLSLATSSTNSFLLLSTPTVGTSNSPSPEPSLYCQSV